MNTETSPSVNSTEQKDSKTNSTFDDRKETKALLDSKQSVTTGKESLLTATLLNNAIHVSFADQIHQSTKDTSNSTSTSTSTPRLKPITIPINSTPTSSHSAPPSTHPPNLFSTAALNPVNRQPLALRLKKRPNSYTAPVRPKPPVKQTGSYSQGSKQGQDPVPNHLLPISEQDPPSGLSQPALGRRANTLDNETFSVFSTNSLDRRKLKRQDKEVLVGTPVKEGHQNFALMYDMLTGIRISVIINKTFRGNRFLFYFFLILVIS